MDAGDILKAELKRRRVSYAELARRLGTSEAYVAQKINRRFSAQWFVEVLRAIGARSVSLED